MENQKTDETSLLFVRFDHRIAETAALSLLSLARCDSFERMMRDPKDENEDLDSAMVRLFTEDDAGRNILKAKGSGYTGAAVAFALMTMFEKIPEGKLPQTSDGIVTPVCMAHTTLSVALRWLENVQAQKGQLVEGPTRKSAGDE